LMTIAHSTRTFFDALQQHDMETSLLFISKHSQMFVNSILPINGYYNGKYGYMQLHHRSINTAYLSDAKYRILFADEARGYSAVEYICSGEFRHNNAKFENLKVIIFIHWQFAKISKLNIVDMNPSKVSSLYLTKADKQWNKVMGSLYTACQTDCGQVKDLIADDITIHLNNLYPIAALLEVKKNTSDAGGASGSGGAAAPINLDQFEGKDVCVSLKGKDNALNFAKLAEKLYFDLTIETRVLFSDENTVVAAKILKPASQFFLPMDKKTFWHQVTVMYTINRFNENGLLRDVTILLNRPLLPLDMRKMQQYLDRQYGESLESLVAPLRSNIKVDVCRV